MKLVSQMVGDGYRPKSVIAGFLAEEHLRYLAEQEGIHACQGYIWSLINRINQKGLRPQDQPVAIGELTAEEQALIRKRYPELFGGG